MCQTLRESSPHADRAMGIQANHRRNSEAESLSLWRAGRAEERGELLVVGRALRGGALTQVR